jgi:hypothetical protein
MPTLDQLLYLAERNSWQDLALCAGNVFFCFTLVPMLRHPARPPLLTCIPTGIALLAGGFVFASLHLWFTALTQAITGIQWLVLAFKKRGKFADQILAVELEEIEGAEQATACLPGRSRTRLGGPCRLGSNGERHQRRPRSSL